MAIYSAPEHGYFSEQRPIAVQIGDRFRLRCAIGVSEYRVLRRHRDVDYFETVHERWVTEPDHPCRQSRVGSLHIVSRSDILAAMMAD